MSERSLEPVCGDCGRSLSFHPREEHPARCEHCFETYLRGIDNDFLASYGELGVTGRRTVAETCLRALVVETPPARKVLAMTILEQFLLASGDLIGLHSALRGREREPIVRAFLSFRLDAHASRSFFAELQETPDDELLAALGLPMPEEASTRYPELPSSEARSLEDGLRSLLGDLRTTAQRSDTAGLLGELAGQGSGGPALAGQASWLGLRADQVATLVLDERRRQLVVKTLAVDENRLAEVVDAIDCTTRAASNLIYAYLTVQDEEARLREAASR